MAGFLIGAISNRRHSSLPFEAPSHPIIDTLRFPPAWVNAFVVIALVTVEALRPLFHDLDVLLRGDHLALLGIESQ